MRVVTLALTLLITACGSKDSRRDGAPAPTARGYGDRCGYTDGGQDNSSSTFYAVSGAKNGPFMAAAKVEVASGAICSSVLIGPSKLLTSAHCFEDGRQVRKVTFEQVDGKSIVVETQSVTLHPDYEAALQRGERLTSAAGLASVDLAIVTLKSPVKDRNPVALASGIESTLSRGRLVALVGFGDVGLGAGTKRFAQSHVGRTVEGETHGGQSFNDLLLLDSKTGTGACPGDSGGGVFVKDGEGYLLVGVVNGINDVLYPGFPLASCTVCPRGIGIVTLLSAGGGLLD